MSTGLVVIGGDSNSNDYGFESQHSIWMDIFTHLFIVKIVMLFERTKIQNEAEDGPFLKNKN